MIFYFSGTGNSQWAAEDLAERLEDEAVDMTRYLRGGLSLDLSKEKRVGLVFPVYAWAPPEPVITFVKGLKGVTGYTFGVCTCGQDAGKAMRRLNKIFRLNSAFSLVMPNNYILGSDVDSEGEEERKLSAAKKRVERIAARILDKVNSYDVEEGMCGVIKTAVAARAFNAFARNTGPFTSEGCKLCGQCVKGCPAGTITLENKGPVWGKECYQCLSCINRCPYRAIQYGGATKKRGRYYFGHRGR